MSVITVDTNSWVTDAEVTAYLADRINVPAAFIASGATAAEARRPYILTAYRDLSKIVKTIDAIAADDYSDDLKYAQCEQAFFLYLTYQTDAEKRIALQSQGVSQAGIIKETYKGSSTAAKYSPEAMALIPDTYFSTSIVAQPVFIK